MKVEVSRVVRLFQNEIDSSRQIYSNKFLLLRSEFAVVAGVDYGTV